MTRGKHVNVNAGMWMCSKSSCASLQAQVLPTGHAAAGVGMCLLPNVVISAARRTLWPHDFQIIQARPVYSRPVRPSAPDKFPAVVCSLRRGTTRAPCTLACTYLGPFASSGRAVG